MEKELQERVGSSRKDGPCEITNSPQSLGVIASRLGWWRSKAGLPLKRIAHDIGVSISTVSQWERGTRYPCMEHLESLADYTGIPMCAFLNSCSFECDNKNK